MRLSGSNGAQVEQRVIVIYTHPPGGGGVSDDIDLYVCPDLDRARASPLDSLSLTDDLLRSAS